MFQTWLQHTFSSLVGKIANCRWVWLKNWLIKRFIAYFRIDLSEAVQTELSGYISFNTFFVRSLKPETRPIENDSFSIISPVDGTVSQMGKADDGKLIQAKGIQYSVEKLLTPDFSSLDSFNQASFATIYLAPDNYHRVHMPLAGKLKAMWFVPGSLFSVNKKSTEKIDGLFTRNERVIMLFETEAGLMTVIMVGAMLVRSIVIVWEGVIAPNASKKIHYWDYADKNVNLDKGDELGYFQYGSTVIVLFEKDKINWNGEYKVGSTIKFGEKIGDWCE